MPKVDAKPITVQATTYESNTPSTLDPRPRSRKKASTALEKLAEAVKAGKTIFVTHSRKDRPVDSGETNRVPVMKRKPSSRESKPVGVSARVQMGEADRADKSPLVQDATLLPPPPSWVPLTLELAPKKPPVYRDYGKLKDIPFDGI